MDECEEDIVLKLGPVNQFQIEVIITSIRKGIPKFVIPDCLIDDDEECPTD